MNRNILVAVAWPYASGPRHLGHLAGAYLPADIFARYHRLAGDNVLMVSGSDVHGTPITVRADAEGVTPQEIVDRYHAEFVAAWDSLAIQWELYTSTGTPNHHAVTQDMFLRLHGQGYIDRRMSEQFFDPEAGRFLPDRYVEGTCPHCGYLEARGDQCENCGRTLDPVDLINPRSKLSGSTPVSRETEHFYLRLSDFSDRLESWLKSRKNWRKHVLNFSLGWIEEGLHDRAITRDIDWGVDIPVEGLGEGKKIYVWFDAVTRLPVGSQGMGADPWQTGSVEAMVGEPGRRALLLHRQRQHSIPYHHLACHVAGLRRFGAPNERACQPVRHLQGW